MKYNFYAEKRALRTFLQALAGGLTAYASIYDVDFMAVIGIAAMSGIISLLMGWVQELPEDKAEKKAEELEMLNNKMYADLYGDKQDGVDGSRD